MNTSIQDAFAIVDCHATRLFKAECIVALASSRVTFNKNIVQIHCQTKKMAIALRQRYAHLAQQCLRWDLAEAQVFWRGSGERYFSIPSFLALEEAMTNSTLNEPYLLDADYLRTLDFIREKRAEGRIVVITSMLSNVCQHTNDLLSPERGVLQPYQWTGYNYLHAWRDSLDEYNQLIELLNQDAYVPQYQYKLRRPDNRLCTYETDYYLVPNYLGEPVRIGVSKPEAWQLLPEPQV
ncbi:MAG TPA: hypothetical protein V6D14_19475 [Coleofasciculaceae cyanobacterium]|jgi:hypothetical protein